MDDGRINTYADFLEWKASLRKDPGFSKMQTFVSRPKESVEKVEAFSSRCKIEGDWLDRIDEKLPFFINAVAEERQFVRSEGDITPIDRVRSVSKESIVDLGRHSERLTRDPATTGGRVIPDSLLVVKKENDYAIYENRFLYTALSYLSGFLEIRLNEILALSGKSEAESTYIKKIETPNHSLTFEVKLHEKILNQALAAATGESALAIRRISSALATVRMLLMTPLMKIVSESSMVSFPITKTNILRFDPNFRESLNLFEYLHTFEGKGFQIIHDTQKVSPFPAKVAEDYLSILYADSFFTFAVGNNLENELRAGYSELKAKQDEEAERKSRLAIAKAKRELDSDPQGYENYVITLEEAMKRLEKAIALKDEEAEELKRRVNQECYTLSRKFDEAIEEHEADCASRIAAAEEAQHKAEEERQKALDEVEQKLNDLRAELEQQKQDELDALRAEAEEKIAMVNKAKDEEVAASRQALEEERKAKEEALSEVLELGEKARSAAAENSALRTRLGQKDIADMSAQEAFRELDAQKAAFEAFYKQQWILAKKRIRQETMSAPDPKSRKNRHNKKEEGTEQ
ncbi:MAG: hypothetical protein K6F32_01895 [Bacilli bacterium]|nr:hypothetical protein [Bacilli bacterium]